MRVFEQVTAEAAQTVGALAASLARFDEDGTVVFVGGWSESGTLAFPIGSRLPLGGRGFSPPFGTSGEPQRIDRYEGRAGRGHRAASRASATGRQPLRRSSSAAGSGARSSRPGRAALRSRSGRSAGSRTSPTSSPRLSRTPTPTRSSPRREPGSSRRPTPSAGGWSETCTTVRSNDWSRSRCNCGSSGPRCSEDPPRRRRLLGRADGRARAGARRASRARTRDPPCSPHDRGLVAALQALAERAPVPVELTRIPDDRLPDPIEAAIYYLVAEAITNIAKYAQATAGKRRRRTNERDRHRRRERRRRRRRPPGPGSGLSASPIASRRSAAGSMSKARPAGHPPFRRDSLRLRDAFRLVETYRTSRPFGRTMSQRPPYSETFWQRIWPGLRSPT